MRKHWKLVLLILVGTILLTIVSLSIFIFSKSKERISFVNLHPAYKLTVNQDILKQIMETAPDGQITTWHPAGDKFAARKVWVIIEPLWHTGYKTGIRRVNSQSFTYTIRWVEKGDIDFLFVRINGKDWKTWTPHIQAQLLNWATLVEVVKKYPTGGLSENDINVRLGKIYLDYTRFPLEISYNF